MFLSTGLFPAISQTVLFVNCRILFLSACEIPLQVLKTCGYNPSYPQGSFTRGDGAYQAGILVCGSTVNCGRSFGWDGGLYDHRNASSTNADSHRRNAINIS